MANVPNVSPRNTRGLLDKLIGVWEEIAGSVLGNDRLRKRGQLHQKAGQERLEALQHGAKATKEEAKAESAERGQRIAQKTKESA
ncbi:MAG: hypothetical protein ACRDTP_12405 [Mycobacteriales bacterium]